MLEIVLWFFHIGCFDGSAMESKEILCHVSWNAIFSLGSEIRHEMFG